jgi:hypothetical protein
MKRRADLGDHSRPRFGHAPMLRITLRDVKVSLHSAITLKTDAKRYLKSAAMILLTLPVLYFLKRWSRCMGMAKIRFLQISGTDQRCHCHLFASRKALQK